jgi:hypothetical protein
MEPAPSGKAVKEGLHEHHFESMQLAQNILTSFREPIANTE